MIFQQIKKRILSIVVLGCSCLLASCGNEIVAGRPIVHTNHPTELPTEPRTTRAAEMVSLESPMRCTIQEMPQSL